MPNPPPHTQQCGHVSSSTVLSQRVRLHRVIRDLLHNPVSCDGYNRRKLCVARGQILLIYTHVIRITGYAATISGLHISCRYATAYIIVEM